jgi:RNA polymerase sigma factor (sigma-70 family)
MVILVKKNESARGHSPSITIDATVRRVKNMAAVQLRALLQHLRRIVGPGGSGGLTDAHLLERFVNERDEAAFEVLVWRHGPMVLSVCRRVLRHEQDAEDAFQATFFTFVRKARAIGKRQSVASWLYKVAFRISLEAKRLASKRSVREKQHTATRGADITQQTADPTAWRELRAVLDEEVSRLPEKYRTPVVLCYFQGKTYEEAARELGCPKGTVSIRLMRARELLRPRLARRGLALSGGMLAAVLSENATAAAVSKSLLEGTVKAALLFAAGKTTAGVFSAQAIALTEEVLKTMFMTKLKIAAALLLAVGVAGSGAGALTYGGMAGEQAGPQAEKSSTPPRVDREEQKAEPIRPVVRTREDKLNLAAADDPAPRIEREKRSQLLPAARDYLHHAEEEYYEQERRWIRQLVEARLRLMQTEDQLRMAERENNPEAEKVSSRLKTEREEVKQAEEVYADKDNPHLKARREALRRVQEKWDRITSDRANLLSKVRREFVEAEGDLRLLERMQAIQREKALRELEAAGDQVRRLQVASPQMEPAARGSMELEVKVDRLLREIAELRREIRRQSTDKASEPFPRPQRDKP